MKLNTRRTLLIGLAFFSICAFWQMYDTIIPLILRDTFHIGDSLAGAIMAADNVLALFLLPLFGKLSDRTDTPLGKRMPYILGGTACAVVLTLALCGADAPGRFGLFIIVLGLLLVAMGTYRSPAVALMPDVTPKPLRSKANAIINLMGAVGGIIYLGVAAVMYPNSKVQGLAHVNYQPLFMVVSAIMFIGVGILFLTIKEPKLVEENRALEAEHPEWDLAKDDGSGNEVLVLNEKDRAKVGEKITSEANRLRQEAGLPAGLTLAPDTADIDGGLFLRDKDSEVNCTLETLLRLGREELAGQAAALLFD